MQDKLRDAIAQGEAIIKQRQEAQAKNDAERRARQIERHVQELLHEDMIYKRVTTAISQGCDSFNLDGGDALLEAVRSIPGFQARLDHEEDETWVVVTWKV